MGRSQPGVGLWSPHFFVLHFFESGLTLNPHNKRHSFGLFISLYLCCVVDCINESMQHWHSQCCIWVFMRATPHTINDWSISNLFYYANPAELGDALCDPLCLPPYFEPISAHQLRDATDFKLGLATSFCESIRSGCALKICPTLLHIFLPVVCLLVSNNCTSLVEVGCSCLQAFPFFDCDSGHGSFGFPRSVHGF